MRAAKMRQCWVSQWSWWSSQFPQFQKQKTRWAMTRDHEIYLTATLTKPEICGWVMPRWMIYRIMSITVSRDLQLSQILYYVWNTKSELLTVVLFSTPWNLEALRKIEIVRWNFPLMLETVMASLPWSTFLELGALCLTIDLKGCTKMRQCE